MNPTVITLPSAIFDDNKAQIRDPIVQCVQIKPLPPQPNHPERYRAVFSDIANYVQTMLATRTFLVFLQIYETTGRFIKSTSRSQPCCFGWVLTKGVLCSTQVVPSQFCQGQEVGGLSNLISTGLTFCRILIILDLEVLRELGESEKIGEPKPLESKPDEEETNQPTTISTNGFYGSKIQGAQPQPNPRAQPMRAPAASAHATIYPIEAISPYSNKWTIKARCTSKSNIKTWHNKNGEGKLFSVNLLDDSGEIRATGFNDQCDMLFDLFQEGSVYYISSPCRVQIAKKQFTNLNSDYELTFERDTLVEKVCTPFKDTRNPSPAMPY